MPLPGPDQGMTLGEIRQALRRYPDEMRVGIASERDYFIAGVMGVGVLEGTVFLVQAPDVQGAEWIAVKADT